MKPEFKFTWTDADVRDWGRAVGWNPKGDGSPGHQFAIELLDELTGEDGGDGWDQDEWDRDEWGVCRRIAEDTVYRVESRATWQLVTTWADLWDGGPSLSQDSERLRGPADCEIDLPAIMARDLEGSAAHFLHHVGERIAEAYEEYEEAHQNDEEE